MDKTPTPDRITEASLIAARNAGLVYVVDTDPGIARRAVGKGFGYRDAKGRVVRDARTLDRIRMLAIPPAYTDVWICARPRGHIQATGRDARQRKQYRYHPEWQATRGDGKFERVIAFGEALPRLRRRLRADLSLPGLPRDKVLAIVVALMAETLARVGNDEYARTNKSYGLTTLRDRHVAFLKGGRARLKFRGKGGHDYDLELDDARLVKLVRACQELPGQALFQYKDDDGRRRPVDSGAVNAYLRDTMGADYTAKDFRTWGGTLHAFRRFAAMPLPEPARGSDAPSDRALAVAHTLVVKEVAEVLGNTPTVARKSYIDPSLFPAWCDGSLQRAARGVRGTRQWEQAALAFLKRARRATSKAPPASRRR